MTGPEALPLRLGFARGTAPGKWAKRWARSSPRRPLELVPLTLAGIPEPGSPDPDLVLERVAAGARPVGTDAAPPTRYAVRLYTEAVALVVAADHELSEESTVDREALSLVTLLAHPDHAAAWPDPEPWSDPGWAPEGADAALELVATGLGAILLPLPLARHLAGKRDHAVLPVAGDPPLEGTEIWVSWPVERDDANVQQLVGIMRGRTARSERSGAAAEPDRPDQPRSAQPRTPSRKEASLPKNSRGAQLAAARGKREARERRRRRAN